MKNSDDTATTRTDRVTSPGVVESLRDTAETQTELPSVSGDGVLFTLDSLDGQPGYEVDGIAESVAESADKPVAQAGESAREQPFAIAKFFGRPPLLNHEDWDAYEAWEQTVQAELQPKGLIESLWARDVVHLTWEVERGRRLKKYLLESARPEAIRALVRVRIDDGQVDRAGFDALAAKTARNIWRNDMLGGMDLRDDDVIAQAYRQLHSVIDTLERQIAACETRRNKVLRDLELRREKLEVRAWFNRMVHAAEMASMRVGPEAAETEHATQEMVETRTTMRPVNSTPSLRGAAPVKRGAKPGRQVQESDVTKRQNCPSGETL